MITGSVAKRLTLSRHKGRRINVFDVQSAFLVKKKSDVSISLIDEVLTH